MEVIEEEIEPIISELVTNSEVSAIEESKSEVSQLIERVSSLVSTVHPGKYCEECKSGNPIQGPLFEQLHVVDGKAPLCYCL